MTTIYVLQADYDYEGLGPALAAWPYPPSDQEIFDFLAPSYLSKSIQYGYLTLEETHAQQSAYLRERIHEGRWVIEECSLLG